MAMRKARKTKKKKTAPKRAQPRKSAKKKRSVASKKAKKPSNAVSTNRQAQWHAYKELEKQIEKAWIKLQTDVKKKASPAVLLKGKNHLMLLLGECNYMTQQYVRQVGGSKRK